MLCRDLQVIKTGVWMTPQHLFECLSLRPPLWEFGAICFKVNFFFKVLFLGFLNWFFWGFLETSWGIWFDFFWCLHLITHTVLHCLDYNISFKFIWTTLLLWLSFQTIPWKPMLEIRDNQRTLRTHMTTSIRFKRLAAYNHSPRNCWLKKKSIEREGQKRPL